MKTATFERIADKVASGVTTAVSVASCEEQAVLEKLITIVAQGIKLSEIYSYDLALGFRRLGWSPGVGIQVYPHELKGWTPGSPMDAINFVRNYQGKGLFVLIDCQTLLANELFLRCLKVCHDVLYSNKDADTLRRLIFLGEDLSLPQQLDGRVEVIKIGRPDVDEIMEETRLQVAIQLKTRDDFSAPAWHDKAFWTSFARAASALHRKEIVNLLRESAAIYNGVGTETIAALSAYKIEKLKGLGVEIAQPAKTSMGGYNNLLMYLQEQAMLMQPDEEYPDEVDEPVRGIFVVGPPGTGKSLIAKLCGQTLGLPVFAFKMSAILDKFVGGSDTKMKNMLEMAEAAAPIVLWIDEIEKAFAGAGSDETGDGGVSRRVFGQFLTWMQEKKKDVYVVATANSVSGLPPELLRAGRFDKLFRVDLPTASERCKILAIHLAKHANHTPKPVIDVIIAKVSAQTDKFSGAELEGIILQAKNKARLRGERGLLALDDLLYLAEHTAPIAVQKARELAELRESWKNFEPASLEEPEAATGVSMGRSGVVVSRRLGKR